MMITKVIAIAAIKADAYCTSTFDENGVETVTYEDGVTPIDEALVDAKVKELIYLGDHIRSRVEVCGNDQFIVKIPNSYKGANLKEGATVKLSWKASDSRALDLN